MEASTVRATGSRFLLTIAAAIIIIAGMRSAKSLINPFLISLFLAILCAPLILWLKRRRVPSVLAVLLVVLLLLSVLAAFLAVVSGSVNEFRDAVPEYKDRINEMAGKVGAWIAERRIKGKWVPEPHMVGSINFLDVVSPGAVMDILGKGLSGLIAALSDTLLVILILVFMLLEAAGLPTKLRAAMGNKKDLSRFSGVTLEVQQYLVIKTGTSLATGLSIAIWVAIVGLDFALVWGLLAFLLNYIPNIGSIIAAVPAVLLALVQLGPARALAVAIGFLVVNMVFGNVVEPQLMGRRLGMSTLVVFLSLVFWGWVLGPVGMLLSVPLTMIVKILLDNYDDLRWIAILLDSDKAVAQQLRLQETAGEATRGPIGNPLRREDREIVPDVRIDTNP